MKKSTVNYVVNFLEDLVKDSKDKGPEALSAAKKEYGKKLSTLGQQTDEVLDRKGSNTVRNVRPVNRDKLEELGISREDYSGGAYLDPVTKENITAKSFGKARISTENKTGVDHTEVKPSMKVADEVDETLKGSLYKYEGQNRKNKAATKVNLLKPTSTKKKRNWEWKSRDPDIEDTNQLVSIDHRGKHFYALNTRFSKGAKLETYPDNPDEPRLRPLLPEAKLKFGKVIGYINKSSSKGIKTHPVYKDVTAYSEGGMPVGKKAVAKYAVNFLKKIFDDLPDKVKKDLPDQPKEGGLRAFHGSDKEYQTMDIGTSRKQDQFFGEGFYFTIDPKIAREYANIRTIKDFEKLNPAQRARLPELLEKKVVTPKEIKTGAIHNFKGEMVKVENILKNQNVEGKPLGNLGQNIKEFNLDVKNPYVVKSNKQRVYLKNNIDKIKARGYDSVIYDNFSDRSKQIMVFPEHLDKIKKVGAVDFNKGGTPVKRTIDPILEHHYNNIKEGKTVPRSFSGSKDDKTQTVFTRQVNHPKLNKGKPTLIPSIYDGKELSEKEAIQKAIDSGIKWTSSNSHETLREYDKKLHKQMSPELAKGTFNKGGTPMKNDPPVGSTPSEVADDIPAMISEGEFVIPADVVRYVGLDKIRAMMQEAKHGLACMEDEGLIVDVDEEGRPQQDQKEKSDDKVAIIETVQIEKVDPMMTQMAEGGMTDKDSPVSSPILNPENKPVMAEGGIFLSPDGSLNMNEGGMPMQMEGMMMEGASDPMMEEMPSEEPEMAMPPEFADEMAPEEAEPMGDAPMMNAPVAQEFNGQPHLLAYLNNEELGALQSAGRGLDENGEQILSPEGIPVFYGGDVGSEHGGTNDPGQGPDASAPAAPAAPAGPDNEVGDFGGSSEDENEPKLSKKIKEELDPDKNDNDKTYVSGVGFIDKYIENRLNNPLQGKPAYAVATAAGGGLMRTPVHLQEGGLPDISPENYQEPRQVARALRQQYGMALDQPTLDYLSNNPDVLSSIVGGKPTLDPKELIDASRKHFTEFGKKEDRMGDGLYLAQERLPDLVNEEGNPSVIAGPEGYYDAAKILETQPDISDESLDYLTKNKDVFKNAQERVANEEGLTYDDVAKQHYQMFGQEEGDRRGTEGFESFFRKPDEEDVFTTMPVEGGGGQGEADPMPDMPEGGMMSPPEPAPQQGFYSGKQGQNFLDIIGGLDLGNQEDMREKFKGSLKKYDDGSYDIEEGSELASAISDFRNAEGDLTDPQNAVYIEGDRKGQPIDKQAKGFLTESAIERITDDYAV